MWYNQSTSKAIAQAVSEDRYGRNACSSSDNYSDDSTSHNEQYEPYIKAYDTAYEHSVDDDAC